MQAVVKAHARYLKALEQLDRATAAREDAAHREFERRTTLRELAAVLEVTPGRVTQMVQRARARRNGQTPPA